MKELRRTLAVICLLTAGGWLFYIFWADSVNEGWQIKSTDSAAIIKFCLILIPAFILSIIDLFQTQLETVKEELKLIKTTGPYNRK